MLHRIRQSAVSIQGAANKRTSANRSPLLYIYNIINKKACRPAGLFESDNEIISWRTGEHDVRL